MCPKARQRETKKLKEHKKYSRLKTMLWKTVMCIDITSALVLGPDAVYLNFILSNSLCVFNIVSSKIRGVENSQLITVYSKASLQL